MNVLSSSTHIKWLSLTVAARRLGLRRDTVIEYIRAGTLKGRLCAGHWFLTEPSVSRFQRWMNAA